MIYELGEFMDLHLHTNYSDGTLDVISVLKRAEELKLTTISITDHDTVEAYDFLETINVGNYYSGRIVVGAEINVIINEHLLECLIYDFDYKKIKKYDFLHPEIVKQNAKNLAFELATKAKKLGFKVSDKFFNLPNYKTGFSEFYAEINSHSCNHKLLVKHNILTLKDFYRLGFSKRGGIFHIDLKKYYPTLSDLRNAIIECGGIMVLAHPLGTYRIKNMKHIIKHLAKTRAVDGFECIHYETTLKQTKFLLSVCNKYNLVKTAGSDFHKEHHVMGYSYKSNLKTIIDDKFHFA